MLEGVAFGLKDIFELIKNAGLTKIDQVRVSGGGAKSLLWRQTLANIFETELVTVNTSEGAAFGAALLAGVGLGNWRDIYTACESVISVTGSSLPEMEHFEIYRQNYAIYRDLYPTLRDINSRISKQTKPH